MTQVVVVGGGIAGLAAAWELKQQGLTPLIVEQSDRAGGVILTERIGGYVVDAGPDSLLIQKPAAIELCRQLGIADRLVPTLLPRTAFVLREGNLAALPEGSFLGLPTRIRPFISSPLFSWSAKLRLAAELFVPAKRDHTDESIGAFIHRRFGHEAREYIAGPLLAGIHAGDANRLSIRALFPRLAEAERSRGSVLRALLGDRMQTSRGGRDPSSAGAFVSFAEGLGPLVDALTSALGQAAIRYSHEVTAISGVSPYHVRLRSGDTIETSALVIATPAWSAGLILREVDPDLATLCDGIPYVSSAVVAFGLRRGDVRHPLHGSGFVVPLSERRSITAATWVSSKWPHRAPSSHVLLRAFLGGAHDPGVVAQSEAVLTTRAFADLADVLGITGEPELTRVFRWPHANAQYHVGHLERIAAIEERLARLPGLFLTGSGYRGTGIPDCVADARATAAKLAAFLR